MKIAFKKWCGAFIALCMLVSIIPITAFAAESGEGWSLSDDGLLTITNNTGMTNWKTYINGNADAKDLVKTVSLGNDVTTIPDNAFKFYSNLSNVTSWGGVTSIGASAFYDDTKLPAIDFTGTSVQTIGEDAFNKTGLTSVNFGTSVQTIEKSAFAKTSLTTVNFTGTNVQTIGESAFSPMETTTVTTANFKNSSVQTIGEDAFSDADITTLDFTGTSVQTIEDNAFGNCKNLTSITNWGTNLTTLGNSFDSCSNLVNIPELPATLTSIDDSAFLRTNITGFTVNAANMTYKSSQEGVLLNNAGDTIIIFPAGKTGEYSVEDNITTIADSAFSNSKLTRVSIPSAVTDIGKDAFISCENLTGVSILGSINSIGETAFLECTKLTTVIFANTTPPTTVGNTVFLACNALTDIYVPSSSVNTYKTKLSDYSDKIKGFVTTSAELKTALEDTTQQTILFGADISLESDVTVGANHTVNLGECTFSTGEDSTLTIPTDKTLTFALDKGELIVNNKTVNFGIVVNGKLVCDGIDIDILNSNIYGIKGDGILQVDNCEMTVDNKLGGAGSSTTGINTNLILKNSTVEVKNDKDTSGIQLSDGMKLTMEKSTISLLNTRENYFGFAGFDNYVITADNQSKFILGEGTMLYGLDGKFSDKGNILTNESWVTVGAENATPSADGLSAGEYIWNGTLFAKGEIAPPPAPDPTPTYTPNPHDKETTTENIAEVAKNLEDGDKLTIKPTTENKTIKGDILKEIKGKNVDVKIEVADGIEWTFNGKDIPDDWDPKDINFNLNTENSKVPEDTLKNFTSGKQFKTLSLDYDGGFGFAMQLSVHIGYLNDGQYANLYYYNPETKKLEFIEMNLSSKPHTQVCG